MILKIQKVLKKSMPAPPGVNPEPPFGIPGREEVSPAEGRGDTFILAGLGDSNFLPPGSPGPLSG
jgi:hypothetical protein